MNKATKHKRKKLKAGEYLYRGILIHKWQPPKNSRTGQGSNFGRKTHSYWYIGPGEVWFEESLRDAKAFIDNMSLIKRGELESRTKIFRLYRGDFSKASA